MNKVKTRQLEDWTNREDIDPRFNIDKYPPMEDGSSPLFEWDNHYKDNDTNPDIALMFEETPTEENFTEDGLYKDNFKWRSIPWLSFSAKTLPFGYKQREDDPHILDPIPEELELLEEAKKHLKKYSYGTVARWMSEILGRKIDYQQLYKRVNYDQGKDRRAKAIRKWASRYKQAILAAEKIENEMSGAGRPRPYDEDGNTLSSPRPLARAVISSGARPTPDRFDDGTVPESEKPVRKRNGGTGPRRPNSTRRPTGDGGNPS